MERFYTTKENKPSVVTRTHDEFSQYDEYNASTGNYSPTYGKYQDSNPSLAGILTGISYNHDDLNFKADPLLDNYDVHQSQKNPNTIYFTPEGIMLGGWLIAEPTPYDRIEALESAVSSLEGVSGNALKFVGTITDNGYVDGLNAQEFSPEIVARSYNQGLKMSGASAYEAQNKVVGSSSLTGVFLSIEPFVEYIAQRFQSASGLDPLHISIDAIGPISDGINLNIVIPHGYQNDQSATPDIIGLGSLPYTFTGEQCRSIMLAKNNEYGGQDGDHAGAPSGVMLYATGNLTGSAILAITQNTFVLGNPIRFSDLTANAGLESGYTFIAQAACTLIPNTSNTDVVPGDFVIINNDLPQSENYILQPSDFSIIHTNQSKMADDNTNGLMSALDYSLLHTVADRRASSSQIGQVKVPNGFGLNLDSSTGALTTNLKLSLEQGGNSGFNDLRLFLDDKTTNSNLAYAVVPQMSDTTWGVAKIDGSTIMINNQGQLYSTAKLTWS